MVTAIVVFQSLYIVLQVKKVHVSLLLVYSRKPLSCTCGQHGRKIYSLVGSCLIFLGILNRVEWVKGLVT